MTAVPLYDPFHEQPTADAAIGTLVCTEPITFVDGTLEVGTVVTQVAPLPLEAKSLVDDRERDAVKTAPRDWCVIEWLGKRRRVAKRAFRVERSRRR